MLIEYKLLSFDIKLLIVRMFTQISKESILISFSFFVNCLKFS